MQGYMIGNGVTDGKFDGNALVPFAHGMGLISNKLFQVYVYTPGILLNKWIPNACEMYR